MSSKDKSSWSNIIPILLAIIVAVVIIFIFHRSDNVVDSIKKYECVGTNIKYIELKDIEELHDGEYVVLDTYYSSWDGGYSFLFGIGGSRYRLEPSVDNKVEEFWSSLAIGDKLIIKDGKYSAEYVKY